MSLKINGKTMNDFVLGQKKIETDIKLAKKLGLQLEFDTKTISKESILLTISKRDINYFILEDEKITISNLNSFLEKENVLHNGADNYVLPNYNLALTFNNDSENFGEVLIYHESLNELYEKGMMNMNFEKLSEVQKVFNSEELLTPYKGIGYYKFGMDSKFLLEYGYNTTKKNQNRNYEINNVIFKLKDDKLIQISIFDDALKSTNLYNNNFVINSAQGFEELKKNYKFIERKGGRYVFEEIGICISSDLTELYCFDKSLLPFWLNKKRPITSW